MREIEDMPDAQVGRPESYDWSKILDGRSWELCKGKGKDFTIEVSSFRSAVYSAASRHGVRVSVVVCGNCVKVKAER